MVDNIIKKSLGVVLIVAAHMVFIVCSTVQVAGILGKNITLQFTFNVSLPYDSHFAVYVGVGSENKKKIAEYIKGHPQGTTCYVYPKNCSAFCRLTNLTPNHNGEYWATLFTTQGAIKQSERVDLIVQVENKSSTVPPTQDNIPMSTGSGSSRFSQIITAVFLVSPGLILAAALIWLIWCLVKNKGSSTCHLHSNEEDKQEPSPHQNSNPKIQETVEPPSLVPTSSLVYSVLDFPKRASTVVEMNSNDTEYAAVTYATEKRGGVKYT